MVKIWYFYLSQKEVSSIFFQKLIFAVIEVVFLFYYVTINIQMWTIYSIPTIKDILILVRFMQTKCLLYGVFQLSIVFSLLLIAYGTNLLKALQEFYINEKHINSLKYCKRTDIQSVTGNVYSLCHSIILS
jgi:hypothetical protein